MRFLWVLLASFFVRGDCFIVPFRYSTNRGRPAETNKLWLAEKASSTEFSPELIHDLDLQPLMEQIAAHTVTFRGRRALLRMVQPREKRPFVSSSTSSSPSSSRRRRVEMQGTFRRSVLQLPLAANVREAREAYDMVAQAQHVLEQNKEQSTNVVTYPIALPPFYLEEGPWDTHANDQVVSDDDEWLDLPVLEWTLQDVLKAEKIIERLLELEKWLQSPNVTTWTPLLVSYANRIATPVLGNILEEISGCVKVARVTTATDPSGSRSFSFSLSEAAFPVLKALRAREADLAAKLDRSPAVQKHLDDIREELDEKEESIRMGLCGTIASGRAEIDAGLAVMAELDVWFAKAAFGIRHGGRIPCLHPEPHVNVTSFVHPLLHDQRDTVPIDLLLSSAESTNVDEPRALIISGPNAGGKTLAMKSFGMVAQMVRLGVPIPVKDSKCARPTVGFFNTVISSFGDHQSVEAGLSTFMAQLSTYATILKTLENAQNSTHESVLVLLDELGSGTESEGGGAIAQAIVEHMLDFPKCCVVATTHSSRLKATSFQDDRFACASVSLEERIGVKHPTYRLEYGIIGESLPLEAASRTNPQLPASILRRAASLCRPSEVAVNDHGTTAMMVSGVTNAAYLESLSTSLQRQNDKTRLAREQAETHVQEMATCRAAMIRLAQNYDRQLGFWAARVQECFTQLQRDETDSLALLGNTLDEIRVVQKRLQSDASLLRERGLRLLRSNAVLSDGERVVIVDPDGTWDAIEGSVVLSECTATEICVLASIHPVEPPQRITVARHKIAVWDYDSVFEQEEEDWREALRIGPSVEESKRRLNSVLSTLSKQSSRGENKSVAKTSRDASASPTFTSSRQRKAAQKRKRRK